MTQSYNTLTLCWVSLWVSRFICCYAERRFAECRFVKCRYGDMVSVIVVSVIMLSVTMLSVVMLSVIMLRCHFAECRYAACHHAACHYTKCRGAHSGVDRMINSRLGRSNVESVKLFSTKRHGTTMETAWKRLNQVVQFVFFGSSLRQDRRVNLYNRDCIHKSNNFR
jgi:hypothetical protein